jgi:hypothetical protein
MARIPPEILDEIFCYISEIHDLSPLNLVCKDFACIVQDRQFTELDLHAVDRAETLAELFSQNPRIISETSKIRIGNQFTELYEAKEIWAFLCTEQGKQLMGGMSQVRSIRLPVLDFSPVAEDNESFTRSIEYLSQVAKINHLSLTHGTFSDFWSFCHVIDLFPTVRNLELDGDIRFQYSLDPTRVREISPSSPILESLVLARNYSWMLHTHMDPVHLLAQTGRLGSLRSMTCHCSSWNISYLSARLNSVAGMITELVIYYWQDSLWSSDWYRHGNPLMTFPSIPHLKTLTLVNFPDEKTDWLMGIMRTAQPAQKILIPSARADEGDASRHTYVYQSKIR